MVASAELAGALDDLDILGVLDHAHQARVPGRVGADPADLLARDVGADAAERHPVAHSVERADQAVDIIGVLLEQVERDALRAFRTDTRQAGQFVDKVLQRAFKHQRTFLKRLKKRPAVMPGALM